MEILLGDNKYSVEKVNLRLWLELEEIREKFIRATDIGDTDNTALSMLSFISVALNISMEEIQGLPWYEIAFAFIEISEICIPKYSLAMLKVREKEKESKVSWEYDGRTFYLWSHILADAYGWRLEEISGLDFNDALALLQEIVVNQQLDREWEWGLSEMAYPYNSNTKTSKFHPLPRPKWMSEEIIAKPIKKVKILKAMMPVGNVIWMPDETTQH